jgi:hypothetical protein
MVTCKLIARLGNQMSVIATTIATALRNNDEWLIPRFTQNEKLWPVYFTHLPEYVDNAVTPISKVYYEDVNMNYAPIPYTPNMCLSGYFQQTPYWIDYLPEIREALYPAFEKYDNFYASSFEGCVSIHIRRGDFVTLWQDQKKHPPVTGEYIARARSFFDGEDLCFFSDDPEWVKENFKVDCYGGNDPLEDMWLMSKCTGGHIIANSTFSMWAALLDPTPNQKVIAPSREPQWWHGEGNAHLNTDYLLPPEWIQIKY